MISLAQFRTHIHPLFSLMTKSPMSVDIVYKGKVYEMYLVETERSPVIRRSTKKRSAKILPIETQDCDKCGSLKFNGICMSRGCENS